MSTKERLDIDGNPATLDKMCRTAPEWAANVIRMHEELIADVITERDAAQAELARVRKGIKDTAEYCESRGGFVVGQELRALLEDDK